MFTALLYIIAAMALIAWGIGYIGYHLGAGIHLLLLLAAILVILQLTFRKRFRAKHPTLEHRRLVQSTTP